MGNNRRWWTMLVKEEPYYRLYSTSRGFCLSFSMKKSPLDGGGTPLQKKNRWLRCFPPFLSPKLMMVI